MYKTVVAFNDLQDDSYRYEVGDKYPRKGKKASKARIKELSTKENRRGVVLIAEEKEGKKDVDKSVQRTK